MPPGYADRCQPKGIKGLPLSATEAATTCHREWLFTANLKGAQPPCMGGREGTRPPPAESVRAIKALIATPGSEHVHSLRARKRGGFIRKMRRRHLGELKTRHFAVDGVTSELGEVVRNVTLLTNPV